MSNNQCAVCGQWSGKGHKCPPAVSVDHAIVPPPAGSAPGTAVDTTDRVQRAQQEIRRDPRLYLQVDRLRRERFYDLVRPRQGLTGVNAADMARTALHEYVTTFAGRNHATWQDAWNTLTGATPEQPGVLRVNVDTCATCRGRGVIGWSSVSSSNLFRSVSRGRPAGACPDCRGTRRNPMRYQLPAAYAEPPALPSDE